MQGNKSMMMRDVVVSSLLIAWVTLELPLLSVATTETTLAATPPWRSNLTQQALFGVWWVLAAPHQSHGLACASHGLVKTTAILRFNSSSPRAHGGVNVWDFDKFSTIAQSLGGQAVVNSEEHHCCANAMWCRYIAEDPLINNRTLTCVTHGTGRSFVNYGRLPEVPEEETSTTWLPVYSCRQSRAPSDDHDVESSHNIHTDNNNTTNENNHNNSSSHDFRGGNITLVRLNPKRLQPNKKRTKMTIYGKNFGDHSDEVSAQIGRASCEEIELCGTICRECVDSDDCSVQEDCISFDFLDHSVCLPNCQVGVDDTYVCPCDSECYSFYHDGQQQRYCMNPELYDFNDVCEESYRSWNDDDGIDSKLSCIVPRPQYCSAIDGPPRWTVAAHGSVTAETFPELEFHVPDHEELYECQDDGDCDDSNICTLDRCNDHGCCENVVPVGSPCTSRVALGSGCMGTVRQDTHTGAYDMLALYEATTHAFGGHCAGG